MQDLPKLHGIQIPPAAGLVVNADRAILASLSIAEVHSLWGLHANIDRLSLRIQFQLGNEPRYLKAWDLAVEIGHLHRLSPSQ
jgi:hypothetical protein